MVHSISKMFRAAVALLILPLGQALPQKNNRLAARSFDCSQPAVGLSTADCEYMSSIGMYGQGLNPTSNNGIIWIGGDGPNVFTFSNSGGNNSVTIIIWNAPAGDYQSSFMNAVSPQVSYSMNYQDTLNISVANGVSGAWAALYNYGTVLSEYGQINNTWGEFTTGSYATMDVTREVNMAGNAMSIEAPGCVSNMTTCVFECASGNTCGDSGTYELLNCDPGSQSGATYGEYDGNPSGGCQGWSKGGNLSVTL